MLPQGMESPTSVSPLGELFFILQDTTLQNSIYLIGLQHGSACLIVIIIVVIITIIIIIMIMIMIIISCLQK